MIQKKMIYNFTWLLKFSFNIFLYARYCFKLNVKIAYLCNKHTYICSQFNFSNNSYMDNILM